MQNLARDEAGNVWEIDAAGNPLRMVEAPGQGRVFSLPQNPKEARQEARQAQQDARADRREDRAEDTSARDARNDELANEMKRLEIELKREELQKGDKTAGENRDRIGRLNALAAQIKRVRQLYNTGPGTTKGAAGLADYLPTNSNAQFDTAGASLSAQGLAAFRVPGTGTVSDRDAIMFDRANLPTAATRDIAIEEQLLGLQSRVNEEYRTLGQAAPNWDDVDSAKPEQRADNEVPDPTTGANLKPPAPGELRDDKVAVASGSTREIRDPRLSAQVDAMINAGASKAMIDVVLKRQNFPTLNAIDYAKAKEWMGKNPGKRYFGADVTRVEDMNLLQQAAGSAPGAFLAQMGNAATAGIPAALAGPSGQGALDAMAANSPNASLVGGVLGSVTGMMGAEAAVAARAPAALAKYAPRIADTLYGGLLGFNTAREGEGGTGALTGAAAGLAGGYLGEKAMRGASSLFTGVRSPSAQALRDRDIPLTVGQALGNSGQSGAAIKKVEDALTSVPFVGNMIDARRMEGIEAFNRAAFQEGGAPIGANVTETGAAGIGQLRQEVGQAYDNALSPVTIDPTEGQFGADLMQAIKAAEAIPDVNGAQGAAMAGLDSRIMGAIDPGTGDMSGRGFQEAYRGLARTGRERANSDYGHEVGQVMRQGQDVLAGALDRQNPGAFGAFRAANSTNRSVNVLAEAVNRAKNAEAELFTPNQLNQVDTVSARRLTGPLASASGERPFYELGIAGQDVLPSRLPDSGTWTRALVGGGAAASLGGIGGVVDGAEGATTGAGLGLGATLMLAAGGSRPAQAAMTKILMDRPDVAIRLGDELRRQAARGGAIGAGAATSLGVGY